MSWIRSMWRKRTLRPALSRYSTSVRSMTSGPSVVSIALARASRVAHVDLADGCQLSDTIGPPTGRQGQKRGHQAILVCMSTVVPAVPEVMVTWCISARISATPRPRWLFSPG
jgi:hypothetical protein